MSSADALLTADYVTAATAWDSSTADTLAATEFAMASVTAATWQAADIDEALAAEFVAAVLRYPGLYPAPIGVYPATNQLAQSPS